MRYAQAAWSCRSISGRCRCVSHLARLRLSLPHGGLRRMAQGSITWGPRMPDMGHSCPLTQRCMQNFIVSASKPELVEHCSLEMQRSVRLFRSIGAEWTDREIQE
jgi:hypothetical protein